MATRLFVGLVSLISIILGDFENHFTYIYLTHKDVDNELKINKYFPMLIIINLIVLVMIQVRIEIFKRSVDHNNEGIPSVTEEEENPNCLKMAFEYNNNTIRIVLFIICLSLFYILVFLINARKNMEELILGRLRLQVFVKFFVANLIPMILIKRNPNMYKYCVKQMKKFHPHNNFERDEED